METAQLVKPHSLFDLEESTVQCVEQLNGPVRLSKQTSLSPQAPLSRVATGSEESILFTNPSSLESQNTSTSTHAQTQQQQQQQQHQEVPPQLNIICASQATIPSTNTLGSSQNDLQTYNPLINPSQDTHKNLPNQEATMEDFERDLHAYTAKAQGTGSSLHETESYIHDEASDRILLNTYSHNRRSTRASNTPIEPEAFDPQGVVRHRDSVFTSNSRTQSVDAATLEIERMRNSIILKRKKKKQQQQQQQKVTPSQVIVDDEKVLVGNKVSEGHSNYVIAYNMLTGIRIAVSRCSGIMAPLTDEDFKATKKLVFDTSGNELTPSSKYDFKFKDYCPSVFRELRVLFGLDPADYLMSLTSKYILSELTSPGKSGSFFYFSRDYRFIIKTIHAAEHRQLRKILKDYHAHVKENPDTLISQFYGLHRVKMPIYYGNKRKIHFVVMNNLFPPHKDIHSTYDLKGSLLSRLTIPKENKHVVFKDLNWIEEKKVISFGPEKLDIFLTQLKKDVKLLVRLNIMDYSFLIGFHDVNIGNDDQELLRRKLSVFSPPSSHIEDLKTTNPRLLGRENLPTTKTHLTNYFYTAEGGCYATDENNQPLNQIYYFGIIDCLTNYSFIKRMETFWRSLTNERKIISALPPSEYGERFLNFIENSLNENTIQQKKDKNI